uniref:Uncharacterized protein n=1 Tax=Manihot esculenta TaxID=3983 RepID=A0A2C9VGZ3_MANES
MLIKFSPELLNQRSYCFAILIHSQQKHKHRNADMRGVYSCLKTPRANILLQKFNEQLTPPLSIT